VDGADADWSAADAAVKKAVASATAAGKQVAIITPTIISPTARKLLGEFMAANPGTVHVQYDAYSWSQKLDAWQAATGERALPKMMLNNADLVVGIGADFLGDFTGQSVARDYADRRKPGQGMLRHIQVESNLSLTGSNADKRIKVKPSAQYQFLLALYNEIVGGTQAAKLESHAAEQAKAVAAELKAKSGKALVISGLNNTTAEQMAMAINSKLGAMGTTLSTEMVYLAQGNDTAVATLVADANAGKVGAALIFNANPAYNRPDLGAALAKVPFTFVLSQKADETAVTAKVNGAAHHYLESWGDAVPAEGVYTLQQPAIKPLFNTRQMEDCFLAWTSGGRYYDYLKTNSSAAANWNQAVHDGFLPGTPVAASYTEVAVSGSVPAGAEGMELAIYQKAGLGVGNLANNPWLQELPDPITRVTWDNYITMSAADALEMGLKNKNESNGALSGSMVNVTVGTTTLNNVPVLIQPGQAKGSVGLAVGYGQAGIGKAADGVGVNAFALGLAGSHFGAVTLAKAEGMHAFACTQLHHTMMGRKIVNETSLAEFLNGDAHDWNHKHTYETYKGPLTPNEANLWDDHDHKTGHFWNMSIDLNSCIGCGACVIACHAENNVPVVGKDEIRRSRDMHWLRIDRYYSSEMTKEVAAEQDLGAIDMYAQMEVPSESPSVVFQPVMCQQCNHAPCETVCPVAATTHSSEGLNHMAYNRCIGTRYCANNCPYKVRRFNWFRYNENVEQFGVNYAMNDDLGRMVLNPDVTVRSRGVMEKCSFCIQRIQLAKLEAKKGGRKIKDGEFTTACAQACETGAIVFGDVNDPNSKVAQLQKDKRMYHLLEEVGTQPSVFYQTKVRNLG
jgi:molybdopterin-containing oxidoreductase family iron-sulfur binding subunit